MAAEYQMGLPEYLAIGRRWGWVMAASFVAVLTTSVVLAMLQPRSYLVSAVLMSEGTRIAADVARQAAVVSAEDRMRQAGQRIMSRDNLVDLANRLNVFQVDSGVPPLKDEDLARLMRTSLNFQLRTDNQHTWQRPDATIVFDLSFRHGSPDKALQVVNELVRLFVEGSNLEQTDQAKRTSDFLAQEAEKLRKELEVYENRIAEYRRTHQGAMLEGQAMAMSGIQSLEADLRAVEQSYRAALEEQRALEVELVGARAGLSVAGGAPVAAPSVTEQDLARARSELSQLRSVYSEEHPDLRALLRRIQSLEQALSREGSTRSPSRDAAEGQARLAVSRFEALLAAAQSRANLLQGQQSSIRANIAEMRSQLARAPQVDRDLTAMQRDYEVAQTKFEDIRSQQRSAQIASSLIDTQSGARFSIVEPPILPEYPVSSGRKKTVALGVIAAVVAALGLAALLETLFPRVRGENAITAITGAKPLVVIPYIKNSQDTRAIRDLKKKLMWSALAAVSLALIFINFALQPLPELLSGIVGFRD
jgi:polysaccharide chain length determinant protein (PEP-CTERM system associated)